MKRFFKEAPLKVKISILFLSTLLFIAVFAPYLASDKPIYVSFNGHHYFPIFSGQKVMAYHQNELLSFSYKDLIDKPDVTAIYPLIPFSPQNALLESANFVVPGSLSGKRRHWLGTNQIGIDTISRMIHGTRTSLIVGVCSMLIALFIGLLMGAISGYLGNSKWRLRRSYILGLFIAIPLAFYYGFFIRTYVLMDAFDSGLWTSLKAVFYSTSIFLLLAIGGSIVLDRLFYLKIKGTKTIPADHMIGRFIEFIDGLPLLVLLISLSVIFQPSTLLLVLLIGFTAWIPMARFTRAEIFKISQTDYISACQLMGMSKARLFFRHLIPNSIGPAFVAFTFGVGAAILTESSLSFLGIGVPDDLVSWGEILSEARNHFNAWWLVWCPGLAIFGLLLSINVLGRHLRSYWSPHLKIID